MSELGALGEAFEEIGFAILRVDQIAKIIRDKLVPHVAKSIAWEEMECGQDGYRAAALAVWDECSSTVPMNRYRRSIAVAQALQQ